MISDIYHPSEDEDYLPFQRAGILELSLRKNVLLGDEMGLGKTIQILGYINANKPARVLVICPNNLRLNWLAECQKWLAPSLLESYDIEQCTSSGYFGNGDDKCMIIASYEGLTRYANTLRKQPWDLIVVDEAHFVKNPSAKRSLALYALGTPPSNDDTPLDDWIPPKKVMLTGTPICNYPYEIFPLIHWLDPETWPSSRSFESRYMPYGNKYGYHLNELQDFLRQGKPTKVGTAREVVTIEETGASSYRCYACSFTSAIASIAIDHCKSEKHQIHMTHSFIPSVRLVQDTVLSMGVLIRRLKKEVLPELPKKRRQIIEFPAEAELLDLVEKENALWEKEAKARETLDSLFDLSDVVDNDEGFEARIEDLKQTRRYFFNEIALIRHALARAKVPYVCEHLDNLLESKEKVVLFAHHRDVLEAFYDRYADKSVLVYGGMDGGAIYDAMNKFIKDDSCQLFIGSIKAAGVGLNLQVSSNVVFAELDWVPGVITQAEDRCHRIGQDSSVLIQHLVAADSMDSVMAKRIVNKQKSINKALNRPA